MATTAIEAGLQTIPLDRITPSPLNPRKHFEKAPLQELAESIKVHGVLQAIVVRPQGKGFQLIVGERRWRASKLAGKTDIPAIVDPNLDDRTALEIMVIENLQREDVHPLDEALGYEALMKSALDGGQANSAESIAAKVGKSVGYVYARLKLLALIPGARKAFEKDEITAGHAVLIARLQPDDQEKALKACFGRDGYDNTRGALIPEKSLREWIKSNVQLNLDKAPFDTEDAKLVPTAGACTNCPKRSGTNPALFEGMDLGKNTCLDPACYQAKKMALVDINVAGIEKKAGEKPVLISHHYHYGSDSKRQKGVLYEGDFRAEHWNQGKRQAVKAGSCKDTKLAVFIDGDSHWQNGEEVEDPKGAGKTTHVCTNKKCATHGDRYSSVTGSSNSDAAARRNQRIARHYCFAMFQAITAKVKKLTRADRELIALEFFQKLGHYSETPMISALGWDKKLGQWNGKTALRKKFAGMKDDELDAHLLYFAIAPDLNSQSVSGAKDLPAVAKRHKINTTSLLKASQAKFAKKKPVQTSVKAKAAAKGKA